MARARLFVAAWLPEPVLDTIAAIPRPEDSGVRYTRRDQWHVTLRFIGSCEVDEVVGAFATVDAPAAQATLGPAVERLGRGAVVVPVEGLDQVAGAVRRATADVGASLDPRPFTGHITVARLRGHRVPSGVVGHRVDARFTVTEIHLVRSNLHPDGARYDTIASKPLRR